MNDIEIAECLSMGFIEQSFVIKTRDSSWKELGVLDEIYLKLCVVGQFHTILKAQVYNTFFNETTGEDCLAIKCEIKFKIGQQQGMASSHVLDLLRMYETATNTNKIDIMERLLYSFIIKPAYNGDEKTLELMKFIPKFFLDQFAMIDEEKLRVVEPIMTE